MEAQAERNHGRWFYPSLLSRAFPCLKSFKTILTTSVEGYIGCAEAIRKLNYLSRLSEVEYPPSSWLAKTTWNPVSASKAMHERIPNSRLVILPSAITSPMWSKPRLFNCPGKVSEGSLASSLFLFSTISVTHIKISCPTG
jgi:3-oxoadipate enol-lactonase